ncbi:MAG: cation-translocating P-type ATPase [Euryarchaeota archaeon]|nr:cation-translocating P-type ATPase [Euryarchaeota archaeon]
MTSEIDLRSFAGLSSEEAHTRLQTEGHNELPSEKPRSVFAIIREVVREPMFLLLLGGGGVYLLVGDVQEGLILLSFVFVVMGITFYQERRTERTLAALRDLSSPRALVIREGSEQRIAGRDVVRDDIVVLHEGDRVPADGVLLSSTNLSIDESLLTGESAPVRKAASRPATDVARPGGDDTPFVYSGTLVVRGQGVAQIRAIGAETEIGRIGTAIRSIDVQRTRLQQQTGRLVRSIALAGFVLFIIVVVAYGALRGNWLEGLLAGIAVAMAMLPEEFPVVLTVFLVLGAWRISKQQVLTRKAPAVETLGAATVLCTDKTGTITLNRMTVKTLATDSTQYDVEFDSQDRLPERYHELVEYSVLASQRDPFDPMEKAFKKLGEHYLATTEHLHADWTLVREYPLSEHLLALSHVWRSPNGGDYIIAAKGAPEAIADLCHFDEVQLRCLVDRVTTLADRGLRVLGVAKAQFRPAELPPEQHEFAFEFLGLIGLVDPIRPTVPQAVQECYSAGIRVIMITGDYPGTARSIAEQIGLLPRDSIITGPELETIDDKMLQERLPDVSIFARTVPEQKLRIVRALKANHQVVAMTGDGVNDAPAMKAADIGVAMGARGTDVAREASSLVLLDDDFSSIVQAVALGRRIYDNIKKAMGYILAIHVPIAGITLLPVLFNWPLILFPIHIAFLELIIDPASSIAFEAEPADPNVMKRPPRHPSEPLFTRRQLSVHLLQGVIILVIVMLLHVAASAFGQSENQARTIAFAALVFANITLILSDRSWSEGFFRSLRRPNRPLWYIVGGAIVFLAGALYIPSLQALFRFAPLSAAWLAASVAAGAVSLLCFEGLEIVLRRTFRT